MPFALKPDLLDSARKRLSRLDVYWVLGGAGSGKSTLCDALSSRGFFVVDMDSMIFGSFHARFDAGRHPANFAWSSAESSLGFLLSMSWMEFDAFHRAALVEYLDLLADELAGQSGVVIVDGGAWHPSVLVEAIPAERLTCIQAPHQSSRAVWEGDARRFEMRGFMNSRPDPDAAWTRFLELDEAITETVARESREVGARILTRADETTVEALADQLIAAFDLEAKRQGGAS